jgi:hypothetical protein
LLIKDLRGLMIFTLDYVWVIDFRQLMILLLQFISAHVLRHVQELEVFCH